MKLNTNIIIAVFSILLTGCSETVVEPTDKPLINSQAIKTYNDIALENAIISQHTLYPYHFVQNGADLNELGKRDLMVLVNHFVKNFGHLNIRKSDTSTELYEARVESVYEILQKAGLEMDKINISDDMPGGAGLASESILVILLREDEQASSANQIEY